MKNVVFNADNGNAKMDAGYHFKNGASSKSHTSRRNFIKTGCIALLAAGIAFSGCKKDEDEIPSSAFDGKLTAKVENAGEYPTVSKIKALDWYGAEIVSAAYSNGDFALTFPQSPGAGFLKDILSTMTDIWGFVHPGFEFSFEGDVNPKWVIVDTFEAYDGSNNWVADLFYIKLGNPSSTYAVFLYVDMDVTLDGDTDQDIRIETALKKGWNTVYVTYNSTTDKEVWSTKEVSGLKWYFSDDEE